MKYPAAGLQAKGIRCRETSYSCKPEEKITSMIKLEKDQSEEALPVHGNDAWNSEEDAD